MNGGGLQCRSSLVRPQRVVQILRLMVSRIWIARPFETDPMERWMEVSKAPLPAMSNAVRFSSPHYLLATKTDGAAALVRCAVGHRPNTDHGALARLR